MQFSRAGHLLPASIQKVLMSGHLNAKYDFANFCLEPTGIFNVTQHAFVNDALLHRVITGSIIVKDEIKEVTETAVIFSEGDAVENVDALVFCTGFKLNFPFAKNIICVKEDHYSNLYKHVFLADVDKNTLAVIGAVDVLGSAFPVIETQTRVAAEVFAGRCTLPTKENMLREIEGRQRQLKKIGVPAQRMIGVSI